MILSYAKPINEKMRATYKKLEFFFFAQQTQRSATLLKRDSSTGLFTVKFPKCLRTTPVAASNI